MGRVFIPKTPLIRSCQEVRSSLRKLPHKSIQSQIIQLFTPPQKISSPRVSTKNFPLNLLLYKKSTKNSSSFLIVYSHDTAICFASNPTSISLPFSIHPHFHPQLEQVIWRSRFLQISEWIKQISSTATRAMKQWTKRRR